MECYNDHYQDNDNGDDHPSHRSRSSDKKINKKTNSASLRRHRQGEDQQSPHQIHPHHRNTSNNIAGNTSSNMNHLASTSRRAIEKAMFDTICAFSSTDNNNSNNNNGNHNGNNNSSNNNKNHSNSHNGNNKPSSEEFKFRLYQPETTTTTGN